MRSIAIVHSLALLVSSLEVVPRLSAKWITAIVFCVNRFIDSGSRLKSEGFPYLTKYLHRVATRVVIGRENAKRISDFVQ